MTSIEDKLDQIKPKNLQGLIKILSSNKRKSNPDEDLKKQIREMEISTIDFLSDL